MNSAGLIDVPSKPSIWDALRFGAALGIGVLIMLRATVFFAPQLVFDIDPVMDSSPIVGLGPAQSLAIDALLFVLCAIGLCAEIGSGRKVDLLYVLLALGGLPMVFMHGHDHLGNLWRGVSWAAAIMSALTVAHLARDRHIRSLILSLAAAAIAAVLVRGLSQMFYEHALTMADYRSRREAFLQAQGWSLDSVQALLYEQRLSQNTPQGWFITTNLLGTFAASAMALWAALALGVWRHLGWRQALGSLLALLLFFGVAAFELYRTDSKGAFAAGALGMTIVLGAHLLLAMRKRWQLGESGTRRWAAIGGAAFIALIIAAVLGIVARGTLMPEHALGDKSLLFRWHYMQASLGMMQERVIEGIGPDQFQEYFVQHRPPRCPEEVTSAHNVLLDWAVTLGVFGWAWIGLLFVMAARAGARLLTQDDAPPAEAAFSNAGRNRLWLLAIGTAVLLGLGASFVVESPALGTFPLQLWRGAGIVAGLLVALLSLRCALLASPATLAAGLSAGAAVILVHGQIEMTLTQPASAALALMIVALAAPARDGARRTIAALVSVLLLALAVWLLMFAVRPSLHQQNLMIEAARSLDGLRSRQGADAEPVVRARAAGILRQAYDALPTNADPTLAGARQLRLAAGADRSQHRSTRLREAIGMLELAIATAPRPAYHALMAQLHAELARATGDDVDRLDALTHARRLTELDPNGLSAWSLYAQLCDDWQQVEQAILAYQRVLDININMELDPLKQLREDERARVEQRLHELRRAASAPDSDEAGSGNRER